MLSDQNATMLGAIGANHRFRVCAGRIGTRSAAAGSELQVKKTTACCDVSRQQAGRVKAVSKRPVKRGVSIDRPE